MEGETEAENSGEIIIKLQIIDNKEPHQGGSTGLEKMSGNLHL